MAIDEFLLSRTASFQQPDWFANFADLVFGNPRPCDCLVKAMGSLVGQQMFPLISPPEVHLGHCRHFANLFALFHTTSYFNGLTDLCRPEAGFADRCGQFGIGEEDGAAGLSAASTTVGQGQGTVVAKALEDLRSDGDTRVAVQELLARLMRRDVSR